MTQNNIRNFCIIAHIDHGKSTLADRFLELTKTVEDRKMREQLLDQMDLERERGITIKLQPVRMRYNVKITNSKLQIQNKSQNSKSETNFPISQFPNSDTQSENSKPASQEYILNLIDTPGHVDFSYEVSRSLAAVEGTILLVDATKGIQAQTLANLYLALEQDLVIIPVVNKIDLKNAMVEKVTAEIAELLGINPEEVIKISAKQGTNIEEVLKAVIKKIPPPQRDFQKPLRALVFDSIYDSYKGIIAYVRIADGHIRPFEKIKMMAADSETEALEIGIFKPHLEKTDLLQAGEIGYIATGLKEINKCRVGDTITNLFPFREELETDSSTDAPLTSSQEKNNTHSQPLPKRELIPLPGYKKVKPMVFASVYPTEGGDYLELRATLEKLKLNDASLSFEPESSPALGRGFKCGFLGVLHLEIITERLNREYNLDLIVTTPSVKYKIIKTNKEKQSIFSPADLPDASLIEEIQEPWVKLEIITPKEYLGQVMNFTENYRSEYKNTNYLTSNRTILTYEIPLSDIIVDFHDGLKSVSSGFASLNYELIGYRPGNLIRLDILVAEEKINAFSRIVPEKDAYSIGRQTVERLKDLIPRQNFAIAIQAAISGKIIARETVKPFRKDVTAKLYGGDVTRKRKLLEKQKKGKKRMRSFGKVEIPQEAFVAVLRKE